MKRFIPLLTILIASCTPHLTEAPTPLAYPFPSTFKQVIVSFQNLPEHWSNFWSEDYPDMDTSTSNSGSDTKLSGTWAFDFDSLIFIQSGDTTKVNSSLGVSFGTINTQLTAVVDQSSGMINALHVYYGSGNPINNSSNGFDCQNIVYRIDSSNRIIVNLLGQSVAAGLIDLSSESYSGFMGYYGTTSESESKFSGAVISTSSLTITFIP